MPKEEVGTRSQGMGHARKPGWGVSPADEAPSRIGVVANRQLWPLRGCVMRLEVFLVAEIQGRTSSTRL